MKIIFIGLPGSGKTTQAKILSNRLNIPYISMRQLVKDSHVIKTEKTEWHPLDNDIAIELCRSAIADKQRFILDGFPRSKEQHQGLEIEGSVVISLSLDFEQSIHRMLNRGDSIPSIKSRIDVEKERFPKLTESLDCFRWTGERKNIVINVDASQSPERISAQIINHPVIWFLGLSAEIKDKLLYLYDPHDGCYGSIFRLNDPIKAVYTIKEEVMNEF